MDTPDLSVIICSHNPRADYLSRVLQALESQTLAATRWELVVIDNASAPPLHDRLDLSWKHNSRLVREESLGLTVARLRGIREASGPLLVFVDDDNVLASDYLEVAIQIGDRCPFLGAWGGSTIGHFEAEPPPWVRALGGLIAVREVQRDQWSNFDLPDSTPVGAGLCVRAMVARDYERKLRVDVARKRMDRLGGSLMSGGDVDLALCSHDLGLGTGVFKELVLEHWIPTERTELSYLLRLQEAIAYSQVALATVRRARFPGVSRLGTARRLVAGIRGGLRALRFFLAQERGYRRALREISGAEADH